MVEGETNDFNVNNDQYEDRSFEMLTNLVEENNSLSNLSDLCILSTNILNDNEDFSNLKLKMNSFIKANPLIVDQIKRYFSDQLIEHILKRLFRVQFTFLDSVNLNNLYQHFFIEQDQNIRIIFNYFFDDIRLLILTGKFENIPWSLRQAIIYTPKSILLEVIFKWIHLKGAQTLTSMLFRNLLNPTENANINSNENELLSIGSLSFNKTNVYLLIIIYLFILFAINIHIIATMINCLTAILLLILIFYYSLNVIF